MRARRMPPLRSLVPRSKAFTRSISPTATVSFALDCAGLPDQRKGPRRDGDYTMADIGLSAFSIFFMGSPSFLGHQRALEEGHGRSNCQTLFGMSAIPSDNYIRLMLDGASPAAFDGLFMQAIETGRAADPFPVPGRAGADRAGWDRALLLAQDQLRAVLDAAARRRRHRILPRLPGCQHGRTRPPAGPAAAAGVHRAARRGGEAGLRTQCRQALAGPARPTVAHLRPVYLGDDLFACQPIVAAIHEAGGNFILTCKPASHQTIAEYLHGATCKNIARPSASAASAPPRSTAGSPACRCAPPTMPSWSTGSPSRSSTPRASEPTTTASSPICRSPPTPSPNWPPAAAPDGRSRTRPSTCSRPTDTTSSTTSGTARKTLASVLVTLNLLAFAFHTAAYLARPGLAQAVIARGATYRFFEHLRTITAYVVFQDWPHLLRSIAAAAIRPP